MKTNGGKKLIHFGTKDKELIFFLISEIFLALQTFLSSPIKASGESDFSIQLNFRILFW